MRGFFRMLCIPQSSWLGKYHTKWPNFYLTAFKHPSRYWDNLMLLIAGSSSKPASILVTPLPFWLFKRKFWCICYKAKNAAAGYMLRDGRGKLIKAGGGSNFFGLSCQVLCCLVGPASSLYHFFYHKPLYMQYFKHSYFAGHSQLEEQMQPINVDTHTQGSK